MKRMRTSNSSANSLQPTSSTQSDEHHRYKVYALLLLILLGGIAASTYAYRQRHTYWDKYFEDNFEVLVGDEQHAELLIFGHVHEHDDAVSVCIESYNPDIVLIEGVPRGLTVNCEDHMVVPHTLTSNFKPTCIGWDTSNATFYKKSLEHNVNEQILLAMQQLSDEHKKHHFNEEQFSIYLNTTLLDFNKHKEAAEKKYGFTQEKIETPAMLSQPELNYQYYIKMLDKIRAMQEQLNQGQTVQKILSHAHPAKQNRWEDEQAYDDELLERNKAMFSAIQTYATSGTKTALKTGLAHVQISDQIPNKRAVHYLFDAFSKAHELQRRTAILIPKSLPKRYKSYFKR